MHLSGIDCPRQMNPTNLKAVSLPERISRGNEFGRFIGRTIGNFAVAEASFQVSLAAVLVQISYGECLL